ncbi:MAG: amidohydrolase, partial [Acidobacteria bacterium]|nr:amidohydrolase [Acidobacteriota bacterium]
NSDWHEGQLREQRLPLRRDLDRAAPGNPVVVVRGGHEYILNSQALERWEITTDTPVPDGGRITRYPDGELNGELVDTAKRLVTLPERPPRDLETRIQDQVEQYRTLHGVGLTSIRHPGGSLEQFRLLEEMRRRGLLTMRVTFLMRMRARTAEEVDAALAAWDLEPQAGDEWLRLGGIKLGVDGGFEGGLMREPYEEPWGQGGTFHGLRTMPQDTYNEVVLRLAERGWRVATHAVGDLAIDQVLEGYEKADEVVPLAGKRWAIEHGFIPQPDQFPTMNRLGLLVAGQHHLYLAGPSLEKYWGRERADWTTPMRAYLDAGVMVSAGTDAPVVPYPPLWVLHHFVTRETISGGVFGEDQRVSVEEGLRLITHAPAFLNFEEDLKGTLEPGKLADFVVLSDDPREVPADEIQVEMTVVGGETVFQR